jgi:hypothetical protein
MTNEQLAALLRPYLLDLSDLAVATKHVIPGNEAMMLASVAGRLELVTKTLQESILRLDNPLVAARPDTKRPILDDETLTLAQSVGATCMCPYADPASELGRRPGPHHGTQCLFYRP